MKRSSRASRLALTLLTCVAAGYGGSVFNTPRAAGGPLLVDVPGMMVADSQSAADSSVRRSRYASIDFNVLRARSQRVMLREPTITLELFPDVTVFAEFDRYDPNPTGVTWVGRVERVPMSTVTLVYSGGLMAGTVVMPNGVYQIRPAPAEVRSANPLPGRELHVVAQIDQHAFPPEAPPIEVDISEAARAAAAATPMTDTADIIDVMVVYTARAAAAAGGPAGISNLINLGVSETNTSYANSGVAHRIRLVHAAQVPYEESGNFATILNDLRFGAGGLAGVAALRDAHGADLVKLLVRPASPNACGIAFLMASVSTAFASAAFSVTDTLCVSPNYTFAHELGHNMGARHDWYVDSATTPFSYAHGYVDPNVGQRWRTIMAYPDRCTVLGFSCTRLLYWANPDRRFLPFCDSGRFNCAQLQYWYYPGPPMGVPAGTSTACQTGIPPDTNCDADDRLALNNTAPIVANLRQSLQPGDRRRTR